MLSYFSIDPCNKKGISSDFEKIVIETGLTQGDVIVVLKGIEHGDEIIQEGARSVNNGQTVKIINQ